MRFFLSILGVVIFIVAVIVIIASQSSHKTTPMVPSLTTYNHPGSYVSQTTTGQLVAEENRQAIQITVSQDVRAIYILTGYEQTISKSETFTNTSTAYSTFLGALENAGFMNSRSTDEVNMFGVCPLGNTYQYALYNNGKTVFNNWSTSCSTKDGTFNGLGSLIRQLFSLQIPNYTDFTQSATSTVNTFVY